MFINFLSNLIDIELLDGFLLNLALFSELLLWIVFFDNNIKYDI